MTDRSTRDPEPPQAARQVPPAFDRLRVEREETPDGRNVLYFTWPETDHGGEVVDDV